MTNGKSPNPKRLADVAETDAIRRLLGGVMRRNRKVAPAPIPPPKPEPQDTQASAIAFVADNVGEIIPPAAPPPLPEKETSTVPAQAFEESTTPSHEIESAPHRPAPIMPPPLAEIEAEPVTVPIGALSFGEFLQRINWRNRPECMLPLPLIGVSVPTGYADTVEGVLTAINWDDE